MAQRTQHGSSTLKLLHCAQIKQKVRNYFFITIGISHFYWLFGQTPPWFIALNGLYIQCLNIATLIKYLRYTIE